MRFMMLMYPDKSAEQGVMPDEKIITEMMKYNEELTRAGVLLSLDGLQPTSKGARVRFADGKPTVTDGPFTEAKELIGGYWIINVGSKDEAVAWAKRCPAMTVDSGAMIEVRQVFEMSDFGIEPDSELAGSVERVASALPESVPAGS